MTRLPTRKPGIERYNRIIEAAEELVFETGSLLGIVLDFIAMPAYNAQLNENEIAALAAYVLQATR